MSLGSILVVEDDAIIARDIAMTLDELGYTVAGYAASGAEALRKARAVKPDLVLLDISLEGDMRGTDVARSLQCGAGCPVVFLSGSSDARTISEAAATGPLGYVPKPFTPQALRCALEVATARLRIAKKAEESGQWSSAALAANDVGVVALDAQGRVQFLNSVAERITGWESAEAKGQTVENVCPLAGALRTHEEHPARTVLRTAQQTPQHVEEDLLACDGSTISVAMTASPLRDCADALTGAVVTFRDDATSRARQNAVSAAQLALDATLTLRNRQLTETLDELREVYAQNVAFDSAVAHELRARVHLVSGYAEMVAASAAKRLKEEEVRALSKLEHAAHDMEKTITALLSLFHAADAQAQRIMVDLAPIARAIVDSFISREPARNVSVHIAPEIWVDANPILARIALENMLHNAWKYTQQEQKAQLVVGHALLDECAAVVVRDNGVGFDEGQWGPTRPSRLDGAHAFEGHGLGMALVERIAAHHGGRLLAAGQRNLGAEFTLSFGARAC